MGGLWGPFLSSAIGSILAAPRTLQALADDNLVPAAFGRVDPEKGEPMFALWVSGAVALVAVALGDLNAVASVVTMFFLTTYGMLNLASCAESVADPAFRPKIKVPLVGVLDRVRRLRRRDVLDSSGGLLCGHRRRGLDLVGP